MKTKPLFVAPSLLSSHVDQSGVELGSAAQVLIRYINLDLFMTISGLQFPHLYNEVLTVCWVRIKQEDAWGKQQRLVHG